MLPEPTTAAVTTERDQGMSCSTKCCRTANARLQQEEIASCSSVGPALRHRS